VSSRGLSGLLLALRDRPGFREIPRDLTFVLRFPKTTVSRYDFQRRARCGAFYLRIAYVVEPSRHKCSPLSAHFTKITTAFLLRPCRGTRYPNGMKRHIVFIGLRGSGKSTAAAALAKILGVEFVDLDDRTLQVLGAESVRHAFREFGEHTFREAECDAMVEVLRGTPSVVALGGGTPTAPGAATALEAERAAGRAVVVFLDPPIETLEARLSHDPGDRPSITGVGVVDEIRRLAVIRRPLYAALADLVVEETVDACVIAERIARLG